MAVDALELRPRNAVALFDAAVRLCATTTGVWAITLPTGALLVATAFSLVEATTRHESLVFPVAAWTFAWILRAVSQGAACHYVDQQVVSTTAPSIRASLLAAIKRAPALIVASTVMAVINLALWVFTLGIGFLFVGAHAAGYATTMRGQGSVLGIYGTCSKLLGPTRHIAPWVRVCGASQLILALNVHLMTQMVLSLGRGLFGFDVTFVERFTSLDNPTWLATVAAVTFALFEPVRAATSTLMLIDGRVRQEGLDLIAQVEQLPRRKKPRGVALAIALALCFALPARAESSLVERAAKLTDECAMRVDLAPLERQGIPDDEQSSLTRLISRVERRVFEDDDCDAAEADLREGLRLYAELQAQPAPLDAQDTAKKILSRREFQTSNDPEKAAEEEPPPDEPGWLAKLFKALWEWLNKQRDDDRPTPPEVEVSASPAMAGANAVMIGAIVLVAAVLLFILIRSFKRKQPGQTELDETGGLTQQPLDHDTMSALSKPPETWAGLADELAAKGEYREAIRHLYLALLSRLHRDGVIDYDPTLSNWEYLFAFKGASSLKAGFKDLTRRFDFAWYGNLGVDSLAYAMFRKVAEPLLVPAEGSTTRA
ncbi:MAG: DUF4129 domain-containing protein [Archangium sp.]|nr:DUF4129 domain-containing protein [Archangium sp.]MDP3573293.1 DUF4129 domain-containing protein [Archangium sp.]